MLDATSAGPAFLTQLNMLGVPWITDGQRVWVHREALNKLFGFEGRTLRRKLQGVTRAPCDKEYFAFEEFLSAHGH
jgi:hypothetical protein